MVDQVSNATIHENDNVQLHMLELIKSLQEEVKHQRQTLPIPLPIMNHVNRKKSVNIVGCI